jgi:FixJ family two-component response regulator
MNPSALPHRAWFVHWVGPSGFYASAEDFVTSGEIGDIVCIIFDVQMPGMTGLKMQRRLLDGGIKLPIIFISAFASETVRLQALDNGAMCVLRKSVDGAAVSRCLETLQAEGGEDH